MAKPSFASIAEPFVRLGIPVFPLQPGRKEPLAGMKFLEEASSDPKKVKEWGKQYPDSNVALLARDGEFVFLEFDIKGGLKKAAAEMGQTIPETRYQSSGKGFVHAIFKHTPRSRAIGNRSVNLKQPCFCEKQEAKGCLQDGCSETLPHHHHEWFSFRAHNKYLVGAGSLHPNGTYYETMRDVEPTEVPDWCCDFVERHSTPTRPKPKKSEMSSVSDDFDFEDFCEWYDIDILGEKEDVWQIVSECPGVGYRHEGSVWTGFYWDGSHLGWSCFAQGCPTCGIGIGGLIKFLNQNHEPYPHRIWPDDENEFEGVEMVWTDDALEEVLDTPKVVPEVVAEVDTNALVVEQVDVIGDEDVELMVAEVEKLRDAGEMPLNPENLLPVPEVVAVTPQEEATGLEFPGQEAMYGKLRDIANQSDLPKGWFYPSLLGIASALGMESRTKETIGFVRSNMYVALLGDVGTGKTYCIDAARKAIFLPGEDTIIEDAPGSHSGLMNQLSEEEALPRILMPDELKRVLNSCAIQGSNLPQMLCTLWNKDKTGDSVKKGRHIVYAKLSMLGGLACKDSAQFARLFGSGTVSGLADRFLLAYYDGYIKVRPREVRPLRIDPKPVYFPEWIWDVKDEWIGDDPARRRMSEHALRIALVTAAINGDREITSPCLEAAFRFAEWQLRLREVFRPGLAETKEAECYEAVYTALKQQYDKQQKSKEAPKGASRLSIDMEQEERWRLLNFTKIVNSKSYYRTFGKLIDNVRKSMLENGIISSVSEDEEDDRGKKKRGSKTGFVMLHAKLL